MDTLIYFLYLVMAGLRIATINVEGLHRESKRVGIFQNFIKEGYDIIALQETHCTDQVVEQWNRNGRVSPSGLQASPIGQV